MGDDVVQLVTLSCKWVSVTEYGCLDLVNSTMCSLDRTWPKLMVLCTSVCVHVQLTLEILGETCKLWHGHEESLPGIGIG